MPVTSKARSFRVRGPAAAALGAALLLPVLPAPSAHAAPGKKDAESPVSVSIERDGATLREGDTVTYEITLRNRTDHHYRGLTVAQMLPQSLRAAEASPVADVKPGQASWRTDLPGGGQRKFTLRGDVGKVDDQQGTGETDPAENQVTGGGTISEAKSARSARLSTSVCVQEAVSVTDGKVKREGSAHGMGNGADGGREDRGGTRADGEDPAGGATVGRILNCRSESAMLQTASDGKPRKVWIAASLGTAVVLAGAALFAWRRLRARRPA